MRHVGERHVGHAVELKQRIGHRRGVVYSSFLNEEAAEYIRQDTAETNDRACRNDNARTFDLFT